MKPPYEVKTVPKNAKDLDTQKKQLEKDGFKLFDESGLLLKYRRTQKESDGQ